MCFRKGRMGRTWLRSFGAWKNMVYLRWRVSEAGRCNNGRAQLWNWRIASIPELSCFSQLFLYRKLKWIDVEDRFILSGVNDLYHPILPANASQSYRHNKRAPRATHRWDKVIFSPEHYWWGDHRHYHGVSANIGRNSLGEWAVVRCSFLQSFSCPRFYARQTMDTTQAQRLWITSLSRLTTSVLVCTTPRLACLCRHKRTAPPSPRSPLTFLRRHYRTSVVRRHHNYGLYIHNRCFGIHILCWIYVDVIGVMPLPTSDIRAAAALDGPIVQSFSTSVVYRLRRRCNFHQAATI